MAELITIARPYAQAVFALAKDRGELPNWSDHLAFIADVYRDDQVQQALANPRFTKQDVERLLLAICGERLDAVGRNLLSVLVQNDRLAALPAIVDLYRELREQQENVVEAEIDSAFPLSDAQLNELIALLEKRTGHKIQAHVKVTPELIGGVKIQIGDDVWDVSVRGRLDNMQAVLTR